MRLSAVVLVAALLGVIAGAYLAGGLTGVGGAVIFDSLCAGAWALARDDGETAEVHGAPTLAQVLERARKAS